MTGHYSCHLFCSRKIIEWSGTMKLEILMSCALKSVSHSVVLRQYKPNHFLLRETHMYKIQGENSTRHNLTKGLLEKCWLSGWQEFRDSLYMALTGSQEVGINTSWVWNDGEKGYSRWGIKVVRPWSRVRNINHLAWSRVLTEEGWWKSETWKHHQATDKNLEFTDATGFWTLWVQ